MKIETLVFEIEQKLEATLDNFLNDISKTMCFVTRKKIFFLKITFWIIWIFYFSEEKIGHIASLARVEIVLSIIWEEIGGVGEMW